MNPITLHFKNYNNPNYGPHIRMCTECAVRLWIESDGIWTDDRKIWHNPPVGYINCKIVNRFKNNAKDETKSI
jgi:hypothetical protein